MAYGLTVVSTTATSATIKITGISESYTKSDRQIKLLSNGQSKTLKGEIRAGKGTTGTFSVTLEDISFSSWVSGRSYRIEAQVSWTEGTTTNWTSTFGGAWATLKEDSSEEPDEPTGEELDNFYWRTKSKKYFESGDEVSLVTASKWKKLVGLIEDLIDLTDEDPWYTKSSNTGKTYLSATKCKNVSSGSEIKAEIYDSVRFQLAARSIADMDDPGSVKSKDTIYPEHFNSLQDAINNWIDEYNDSL